MAWTTSKGWNFRSTTALVTDPTNTTYAILTDVYNVTRSIGGENVTFGWDGTSALEVRDRASLTGDAARLGGHHFLSPTSGTQYFRVDVPAAGQYKVRLALGDYSYDTQVNILIKDGVGGSVLATITDASVGTKHWVDAGGTERTSESDWLANNTQITVTLTGTALCVYLVGESTYNCNIAHLELEQIAAATPLSVLVFESTMVNEW
jgi:hypothetical protein